MMTAERLREGEGIELDGILDEPVWDRAIPATDFIQQDPDFGGTPTERTEVRIVFTSESLYMGVSAFDSEPDLLLGNTMKRDEFLSADDRFMWTMDTFLDQQTGYFFEMNPSGLMADQLMQAGGGGERAWDGIWDAYARRHELGWTLEIEIPFRTLNFDPDAPAWGVNFQRTVRRKNEENLWTGHERNQGLRRMSNAGLLLGISDVTQGHGLDVKPYLAGSTVDVPGGTERATREREADVGVDLFYNVTPSLRANLTVNTDFAQTEVDQRLVNLTRFPLRFPEKRDFFLDGATFFDFASNPVQGGGPRRGFRPSGVPRTEPFFSRRIGLGSGGQLQPVDVGGKLTGQAGAQDIGFLQVRTGEHRDGAGNPVSGEDFTVFRLKRRVLTQSYIGSFFSRRDDRAAASAGGLYTAGLDYRLATSTFRGSDQLSMSGYVLWNTQSRRGSRRGPLLRHENRLSQRPLVREPRVQRDPAESPAGNRIHPENGFSRLQRTGWLWAPAGGSPNLSAVHFRCRRELPDRHGEPPRDPRCPAAGVRSPAPVPGQRESVGDPHLRAPRG